MSLNIQRTKQKRIVIVGGGFGGIELAGRLKHSGFQIVLIDKNNYHQFPPLIYQVASAGIEPSSISFPFRRLFQNRRDVFYRYAEANSVDTAHKVLHTSIGEVEYDYLVMAAGAATNFFGNEHIQHEAYPMKTVSEAMSIRNIILSNIEKAISTTDNDERQQLLNIVIVGGGPSGVEIAGALSEMKRMVLPREYHDLDAGLMNIYLVNADDVLLKSMSPESSASAERYLRNMEVKLILGKRVVDYKDNLVVLEDGNSIPAETVIWVSGVRATQIGGIDKACIGRGGRLKVDAFNRVEGLNDVFSIGDQCIMTVDPNYPDGHPQLAQVAIQQARNLAANLKAVADGRNMAPFRYRNLGTMATVGRNKAVAEIAGCKFKGLFAWLLWLVVHLRSILGVRNKVVVLLNWIWNYINYKLSLRLILNSYKRR